MVVMGVKLLLVRVDRVEMSKKQRVVDVSFWECENRLDFGAFENEFYDIIRFLNVLRTLRNFLLLFKP